MSLYQRNLRLLSNAKSAHRLYKIKFNNYKTNLLYTPINICIINKDGEAVLRTIISGNEQEDTIEYTFNAPCLNDITSLLLSSSELKTWRLNSAEIVVCHDESQHEYYFPFFDDIDKDNDFTTMLTSAPKPSPNMKEELLVEYSNIKHDMKVKTCQLTLLGLLSTGLLSDTQNAIAFGMGGCIGLLYLSMLQNGIDNNHSFTLRLGSITLLAYAIMSKYQIYISHDKFLFLYAVVGFSMYRIALLITYLEKNEDNKRKD
jgi:hypothetical protein